MGLSPRQFEQLRQRLARPRPRPEPVSAPPPASPPSRHGVILGIDPSLRGTGLGVIRHARDRNEMLEYAVIHCPPGWERSRCLAHIAGTVRAMIQRHHPGVCVIESLFQARNYQTALILGEARGASLAVAAEAGLEVYELAPRRVKQAIVGYGAAQKPAVAQMVRRLLGLAEAPPPDAADALALALAFAQEQGRAVLSPLKRI